MTHGDNYYEKTFISEPATTSAHIYKNSYHNVLEIVLLGDYFFQANSSDYPKSRVRLHTKCVEKGEYCAKWVACGWVNRAGEIPLKLGEKLNMDIG